MVALTDKIKELIDLTLAFAKYLSEQGKTMWIRQVLVPRSY